MVQLQLPEARRSRKECVMIPIICKSSKPQKISVFGIYATYVENYRDMQRNYKHKKLALGREAGITLIAED